MKKEIEGALFIVRRRAAPFHQLVVMNRLSRTNFVQDVGSSLELQVIKPYLMFRDATRPDLCVHGLWFHDDADRKAITTQLYNLIKAATPGGAPAPPAAASPPSMKSGGGGSGSSDSAASAGGSSAQAGRALLSLVRGEAGPSLPQPPSSSSAAAAAASSALATSVLVPAVDALFQNAAKQQRSSGPAVSSPAPGGGAAPSSSSSSSSSSVKAGRKAGAGAAGVGDLQQQLGAASLGDGAGGSGGFSGGHGLGEVNILLTRKQLQTVLLDMLGDDKFIQVLHSRYMDVVTQQMKK